LRVVIFDLALFIRINPWALRAIDKFGLLILGMLSVIWIVFLENYLRTGIYKNSLWARSAKAFLLEGIVLGASFAVHWLLE